MVSSQVGWRLGELIERAMRRLDRRAWIRSPDRRSQLAEVSRSLVRAAEVDSSSAADG
jgi:hypothetical protein